MIHFQPEIVLQNRQDTPNGKTENDRSWKQEYLSHSKAFLGGVLQKPFFNENLLTVAGYIAYETNYTL